MNDLELILDQFTQAAKLDELYHVTTFHAVRTNNRGDQEEITIEIRDRGSAKPMLRYYIVAYPTAEGPESPRLAMSNPAERLDAAISTTHWQNLG